MINNKRVLALITARSGSKGLPDKNIKNLGGKPLLAWPISAALGSAYVDNVIVSTDSEVYARLARENGAETPFLRPRDLSEDTSSSVDVVIHALDFLSKTNDSYHYVLLLEPTSPLTDSKDIDRAISTLDDKSSNAVAAVGVSLMETQHPSFSVKMNEACLISPLISDTFGDLPRRQDLEPIYSLDGSLYLSTVKALYNKQSFCHDKTIGIVSDRYKVFEVDDIVDFICIEALLDYREKNGLPSLGLGEDL